MSELSSTSANVLFALSVALGEASQILNSFRDLNRRISENNEPELTLINASGSRGVGNFAQPASLVAVSFSFTLRTKYVMPRRTLLFLVK